MGTPKQRVQLSSVQFSSVQFSSVQLSSVLHDISALGKTHVCSTPSLRRFHSIALETVPVFVWLTMAFSRPFNEDLLKAIDGVNRRPWLCASKQCLNNLNT